MISQQVKLHLLSMTNHVISEQKTSGPNWCSWSLYVLWNSADIKQLDCRQIQLCVTFVICKVVRAIW